MNRFLLLATLAAMLLCRAYVNAQDPNHTVRIGNGTLYSTGPDTVRVRVTVDNLTTTGWNIWSFAVCHDPNLLSLESAELIAPDYDESWSLFSGTVTTEGYSLVVEIVDPDWGFGSIPTGTDYPMLELIYSAVAAFPAAGAPNQIVPLEFCSTFGGLPVDPVVFLEGDTSTPYSPTLISGSVTLSNADVFVRGDCSSDGEVSFSDVFAVIDQVFGGTQAPCDDACDVNDDGSSNIADAVSLLIYLFGGGTAPSPTLDCQPDTSADVLTCTNPGACP